MVKFLKENLIGIIIVGIFVGITANYIYDNHIKTPSKPTNLPKDNAPIKEHYQNDINKEPPRERELTKEKPETKPIELKNEDNFILMSDGLNNIKIGMKLSEVHKQLRLNRNLVVKNYEAQTESDDTPKIFVFDKNDNMQFVIEYFDQVVGSITFHSSKYKTYNGLHAGMLIKTYSDIYSNSTLYLVEGLYRVESFFPSDLQSETHALRAITSYGYNPDGNQETERRFQNVGINYPYMSKAYKHYLPNGKNVDAITTKEYNENLEILAIEILSNKWF